MIRKALRRRTRKSRYKLVALLVNLLTFPLELLPERVLPPLCRLLGRLFMPPLVRRDALRNLALALPGSSRAERVTIARRMYRGFGAMAAEILLTRRKGAAYVRRTLFTDESERHLQACLDRGRGVIILTGHFGNWELLAWWGAVTLPLPVAVLGRKLHNPYLNRLLDRFREAGGMEVIDRDQPPRRMVRHLQRPGVLGIVPDQDVDVLMGEFVPFFGRPAHTVTGPAALAILSGAPILPAFTLREGRRHRIRFLPPILCDRGNSRAAERSRITRAWSEAMEEMIRAHPDHWAWWHNRWSSTPEKLERKRRRHLEKKARRLAGPAEESR
jgi:KDO2-lipid IV(A) lauroyltransferase